MKDSHEISDLICRFLSGEADARQIERLEQWLDTSERNRSVFRQLCSDLEHGRMRYARVDTARALRNVEARITCPRRAFPYRMAAAAVALLMLTAAMLYLLRPAVGPQQPLADWNEVAAEVVLTLPDGSRHSLCGTAPAADSLGMRRDSTGMLRVESTAAPTEYYTITVGTGPEQTLLLGDGTRVWLGNGSRLRFPLRFDGSERHVEASGEIYFDVVHRPDAPFIVSTNGSSVSVFGTEFLVQNIGEYTLATLIEGSVAFIAPDGSSARLVPGNQAETSGSGVTIHEVDTRLYTALRDGYLVFDRMTLAQIAAKLESRYECHIRLGNPEAAEQTISARIRRYPTLRPILDMLSKVGHFSYREEAGGIVIE